MKLYAMCTLHETGWGTRAGISDREFFSSRKVDTLALTRLTSVSTLQPLPR